MGHAVSICRIDHLQCDPGNYDINECAAGAPAAAHWTRVDTKSGILVECLIWKTAMGKDGKAQTGPQNNVQMEKRFLKIVSNSFVEDIFQNLCKFPGHSVAFAE